MDGCEPGRRRHCFSTKRGQGYGNGSGGGMTPKALSNGITVTTRPTVLPAKLPITGPFTQKFTVSNSKSNSMANLRMHVATSTVKNADP